ncbi:hypothetical protein ACP4OV_031063 [Aristida adscensionis]
MPQAPDVREQPMPQASNGGGEQPKDSSEYRHRKQQQQLAALVVSVTYVLGLSHRAASGRTAAPASRRGRPSSGPPAAAEAELAVLRLVIVLDLLVLMGAYLAGSCRERATTVYAAALVLALSSYVGVQILQALYSPSHSQGPEQDEDAEQAPRGDGGAAPPDGDEPCPPQAQGAAQGAAAARHLRDGHHLPRGHYRMFFYCNSTAFVASLFIIVLLLEYRKLGVRTARSFALHAFVLGTLVSLVAAYDAGSCRDADCSVYVVSLLGAVLAFVFAAMVAILLFRKKITAATPQDNTQEADNARATKKVGSLVLLLANLAATITYQAGLDPPGGFWPDDGDGHRAGDAILLSTQPARYRVFFYCNSTAFVESLVAILMVQNVKLVKSHTLLVATMLDMFALMGPYAAGTCRDARASAVVVAMAGAVLLYVLTHVLFFTLRPAAEIGAAARGDRSG